MSRLTCSTERIGSPGKGLRWRSVSVRQTATACACRNYWLVLLGREVMDTNKGKELVPQFPVVIHCNVTLRGSCV